VLGECYVTMDNDSAEERIQKEIEVIGGKVLPHSPSVQCEVARRGAVRGASQPDAYTKLAR
jgi:hypothetical protein